MDFNVFLIGLQTHVCRISIRPTCAYNVEFFAIIITFAEVHLAEILHPTAVYPYRQKLNKKDALDQKCQTGGLRAKFSPPCSILWPAS